MSEYAYSKENVDLTKLQAECVAAGLPVVSINGGAIGSPDFTVVTLVPLDAGQVATLDAVVAAHDGRRRVSRPAAAIYTQIVGLSSTQADAIIADLGLNLTAPTGKWATLTPPQDAAACSLFWAATSLSGATVVERRKAAAWVTSFYCQQNPTYLVNPTFHASLAGVNVPGDAPVS